MPEKPDETSQPAVLGDWDRPLDLPALFEQRHNKGGGRGNLRQPRANFFSLSRAALDDLIASVTARRLTDRDCLVVLSLATRAGYTAGGPGLVLGSRSELAAAVGVERERLANAVDAAEALGILQSLPASRNRYYGVRFDGPVYMWLTGKRGGKRPPGLVAAAAAPEPADDAPSAADATPPEDGTQDPRREARAAEPQPLPDSSQDGGRADGAPQQRLSRYAGPDIDPFRAV